MLLYASTIFLSAFLLFQVEPLIAKIILPWFGGSAAVWSASLLFFQLLLLAGYGYAHLSIRFLSTRAQAMLHGGLLLASCALLPILPAPSWKPTAVGDPTLRILALLGATIGLQFFLLSSTTPLLQAWYVRRSGSAMPYRLFALSNFGSMLALISFPFLIEPQFTSRHQAYGWSFAYLGFAALCLVASWRTRHEPVASTTAPVEIAEAPRPSFLDMLLWVALAACASTLLVSITVHLSQNVAPIPLLWVLPLAIYLLTFVLRFERDRPYNRATEVPRVASLLGLMAGLLYVNSGNLHVKFVIPVFAAGLFICCMFCHGELAFRKPSPRHLTLFYFMISLGGAVGGLFVAVIAPRVFHSTLELPIGMVATAVLAVIVCWNLDFWKFGPWPVRVLLILGTGLLAAYLGRGEYQSRQSDVLTARNFYGVLHVQKYEESGYKELALLHGTITHGTELTESKLMYEPTSYYGRESGVGRALIALQARGPVRVGVIGLGAGTLSTYGRKGDYFRVYDINPLVEQVAQTWFHFYEHCAADKQILMGDARLTLERQPPQQFDLIAVDAFSSDAIPVHLLTREAVELYFHHLKPSGVLALHISNRYLDLAPVCARAAAELNKTATQIYDDGSEAPYMSTSTWVLLTAGANFFKDHAFDTADMEVAKAPASFRTWTDDYSNLVQIFKRD